MKLILGVLITGIMISSCNQPSAKADSSKATIDSLVLTWESAWNKHDSVAVTKLFFLDALLIDGQSYCCKCSRTFWQMDTSQYSLVSNLK